MVDDQQTQSLPEDDEGLDQIAGFMAYPDVESFRQDLLGHLRTVEDRYAALFEEEPSLSGPGNLVFTGGEPDPETLKTLATLGFADGDKVFHVVANWHRGRYKATRSRRSREFLTELIPALLEELGKTPHPDGALTKFDEFLAGLPAGVQLFSLLYANPRLLQLLASIVGAAPALADHLSRHPGLLEAVLQPGFFESIPERAALGAELDDLLADARDFQDVLDISRRWANDRRFQVGVHLLEQAADVDEVGRAMSEIAEVALEGVWPHVTAEFAEKHGHLPGPGMAVIAMGKLGGREMTISSDLDLIFVYESGGRNPGERRPEAAGADPLLRPPGPAADQRDLRADRRGPALRGRHAPAPKSARRARSRSPSTASSATSGSRPGRSSTWRSPAPGRSWAIPTSAGACRTSSTAS